MNTWDAAIIGLGKVGMGYDYDCQDCTVILSHAQAYHQNPMFRLVGGVDKDRQKREAFKKKYGIPAFENITKLYQHQYPKVISICVPTNLQYEVFDEVIDYKPTAMVCEKPFSNSSRSAKKMLSKAKSGNCTLIVNYIRRYEPGVLKLKELIDSGKFGTIYKGAVWYGKGLLNNGSHYIDLLEFLLGKVKKEKVICRGRVWDNRDPEPDFMLIFQNATVLFLAAKEEYFTLAELELIGTNGKIQYLNGGSTIQYWELQKDSLYDGYTILKDKPTIIENDINHYQQYVFQYLAEYLDGIHSSIPSSGDNALSVLKTIERLIKQRSNQ